MWDSGGMEKMEPKKLIVGLGNPGNEYASTRHNVGFMVADLLQHQLSLPDWQTAKKHHSELSRNEHYLLMKPTTFMNESGKAVRAVIEYYQDQLGFSVSTKSTKEGFSQLFVIHDDLDLELGKYKIQFGTGPKVHNGLRSIYAELGTELFWHVRVGVDGRGGTRNMPGSNYVLLPFSTTELQIIQPILTEVSAQITQLQPK